ncbi:MAG: C4-dicarboxylate TRAP transporter substrate-binding protein [Woeseiaceae bacterium]|nr:C4-dicarboxylate TRAP transporter substrate-binding protein [Woeseiaceae bacterium]
MSAVRRDCTLLTVLLLMSTLAASAPDSGETEVIPLIAIDSYAPTALWTQVFIDYFIPEVDRRLAINGDYKIRWNKAFGGTIAKTRGVLDALQYDLADIGIVTTPYHSDKVPFYNLPYVTPFVSADIGLVSRTMSQLVERYPQLAAEWRDYRQVYLVTAGAIDTYQILTAHPVATLDDFRGRKIAGVGPNLRYLAGLDATPVNSGLSDWYNNLATGLVDGVISWVEGSVAYRLYEVAPYLVDVRLGAVSTKVINVNSRTWSRLPDEVKTVLREAAAAYRDELAREVDRRAAKSTIEFQQLGGTIVTLDEMQRRAWAKSLPNVAREWADDMQARGLPGHAILEDYMEIMRANGQPIVRHWDRE